MEVKLIKTIDEQGVMYSLSGDNLPENYVLSLKNCQSIENGYDLDELAEEWVFETNGHKWSNNDDTAGDNYSSFKAGFQKALELIGDKKFSEEDVILIAEYIRVASQSTPSVKTKDLFDEYQSLQQTEWEVEIVEDTNVLWQFPEPLLNAENCLILKRK